MFGQVPYSAIDGTRRALMAKMLSGNKPAFDNTIGTGPGAIKSVSTKPDGSRTTTYNTPTVEPIPASAALDLANSGPRGYNANPQIPDQLPTQQAPAAAPQSTPKSGGLLNDAGFYGLLGQLGQAVTAQDPTSFGYQAGGIGKQMAQNQAYQKLLASMLGGANGAANPNQPAGVPALSRLELLQLTPETIQGLIKQNEDLQTGASDRAYKAALASGVETPEQQLNRQALITLLGKNEPAVRAAETVDLNQDPSGKRLPVGYRYKYAFNPTTGNYDIPQGPVLEKVSDSGDGNGSSNIANWYQKAVNAAENFVKQNESLYGDVIQLPDGTKSIQWKTPDAPQRLQADYRRFLYEEIKKLQRVGAIPPGFENVALPELPPEQILQQIQGVQNKPTGSAFPNVR